MLAWALASLILSGGELRWQAPAEQCPSAETVQVQIDAAGGLGELQVDAVVAAHPSGEWSLVLTIVLDDVSDARTLRDASCAALAEAVVLLVATRLDREAAQTPSPPSEPSQPVNGPPPPPSGPPEGREPGPSATEPTRSHPTAPPVPVERRDFQRATGLTFAAAAGISLGTVPVPGTPTGLAFGYAWPNVRVAMRGRVHVAAPRQLADGGSIRVVVGTAGPQVCARPRWRQLEFPLCGEVGFGGSRAVTRGPARDRGGVWIETGVAAGVAWFVDPRWALTAQLAGAAPLKGSAYALGGDELWDPAAVAGRVMLGVEFFVPIQIRTRPEKSQ